MKDKIRSVPSLAGSDSRASYVRSSNGKVPRSVLLAALGLTPTVGLAASGDWEGQFGLSLKETYDSNVYLVDHGTKAKQDSFVTSATPTIGLTYRGTPSLNLLASYSPEVVFYHSESSEDHVAHRGKVNFNGQIKDTVWEQLNSITWIDGSSIGPFFGRGADIPAIGGIPVRNRRDAAIYLNSVKVTQPFGKWFVRPQFNSYVHDFQTKQFDTSRDPWKSDKYENFIDRYDLSGGLDLGYEAFKNTKIVAGYRYGHQEQGRLRGTKSLYSNDYHRILAGLEGSPTDWIKISVLAGPDIRNFPDAPATFDDGELLFYINGSVTFTPTKDDTVTLKAVRYEQPAFGSQSMYEDITYDLSWRHKMYESLTAGLGFTAYAGDWQAPVNREDWIYTPNASLTYAFGRNLSADLSYSYDWVESKVPNTKGREFTRHLVGLGVKYTF